MQIVTGILLALIYVPSAGEAWSSLQALNHDVTLGWFIRALHGWGSNFMVAIVLIHMMQVFLFGAYKFPRELTWIVGVFLLLMTLGMAFTGQVLRFDQDAYWGLGIGASIASRVPIAGPAIVKSDAGRADHRRRHAVPILRPACFRDSGIADRFVCLHLLMVLKLGINEWPMPGRVVKRATYVNEYHELTKKDGAPFVPYADLERSVLRGLHSSGSRRMRALVRSVWAHRQAGSDDHPDRAEARLLLPVALCLALAAPALARNAGPAHRPGRGHPRLLLLPFLSGEGEKSWKRRPIAVLTVMLIAVTLGTFTHLAEYAPWSPRDECLERRSGAGSNFCTARPRWSGKARSSFKSNSAATAIPLERAAAQRGPALDSVAVRLTQDQLIRQVIQGGGNMPAYGKNLSPAETTALVAFLETLHPAGTHPRATLRVPSAVER